MDALKLLAIGYAVFTIFIVVESTASVLRGDRYYRLGETVSNISHGVLYQLLEYFTKSLLVVPYLWVIKTFSIHTWSSDSGWTWLAAFLCFDFFAYLSHRVHHSVPIFWNVHVAHHAAEDFNLAAALRQPLFQSLFAWPFMLPLAIIGFPIEVFAGLTVLNFGYQFWLHTRYLPKLGPVEWVFNTPSHHRVHHGRDPKYLDRNFGGMLIIWDRIFRTYAEEAEEPSYGTVDRFESWNPIWGNMFAWFPVRSRFDAGMFERGHRPSWKDETPMGLGRVSYVVLHALLVVPLLPFLILQGPSWSLFMQVGVALFIAASAVVLCGILERKGWAQVFEVVRLGSGAVISCFWFGVF